MRREEKEMFTKEKIQEIIKSIQSYNAACIGAPKEEQPYVVVGPSGGKRNLRIYCYGGNVGCLGAEELESNDEYSVVYDLISENYKHFLCRYYEDGKNSVYTLNKTLRSLKSYNNVLVDVSYDCKTENEKNHYISGLDLDFVEELKKGEETIYKEILNRKRKRVKYLDYAIAATENKFINDSVDSSGQSLGERKVQTKIVKEYMPVSKEEAKGYIVVDMEYKIPLGGGKSSKPDIMVFDGERIGLVEIKYAGESMGKSAKNSLEKHFIDFYEIICGESMNKGRKGIIEECWRRMDVLVQYNLIHSDWKEDIKKFGNKIEQTEDLSSLIWMGFLFVEGAGIDKNDNEEYIIQQMREQLGAHLEGKTKYKKNVDIRYCYTKQDELVLDMNLDREYILKEIIGVSN